MRVRWIVSVAAAVELGTMYRRADVVASRRLKLVLLAATALVAAVPGLAHASSVAPPAEYNNLVDALVPAQCQICLPTPLGANNTQTPTGGLAISGSDPHNVDFWTATTDNHYQPGAPSIDAAGRATGSVQVDAESDLHYFVEFAGATSTVSMFVVANGQATVAADQAGASGDSSDNRATAQISITDNLGNGNLVFQTVSSNLSDHLGTQSFTFDQMVTFKTNTLYEVVMNTSAEAAFDHTASAFVDPFFIVPDGYTLSISDGIGNAPASVTPLPAALPLFATGLGAIGLFGWRRKRKPVAAIAA